MAKKSSSSKRGKKKIVVEEEDVSRPTTAWWTREPWLKRRTNWLWRLRPFLVKKNEAECGSCQMNGRCNRIPLNEPITAKIAKGKGCSDYKSMWKKILGKDEEYDWGFILRKSDVGSIHRNL